jgi:hypothetical protein
MIDGASVKRGLLERFETETSPILRSNFDRPLPRLQKTAWRRFIVHRCRACMNDDDVHAKRNGKAVPLNSSRPKNGNASHIVVSQR